jgi:hypothetical protein
MHLFNYLFNKKNGKFTLFRKKISNGFQTNMKRFLNIYESALKRHRTIKMIMNFSKEK